MHWQRLTRELVESPSLDVALSDVISGHGGDGLLVGVDDLRGLCQP